jgi:RNA polymerase sigma-70 factor (ECF subfamily)
MNTQVEWLKRLFGQESAVNWDEVFTIEFPRILNYFRLHGVEEAIAEDLTASTFEKAWSSRQSYRSEKSTVSTWLYTIAHHTMIDYFRTRKNELPLDILEDRPGRLVCLSPEEAAQRSDDKECLRRILLRLPDRERELVALKYGVGMTNRAIAKHTGLSETNVGTILNRVVTALRKQMEEYK